MLRALSLRLFSWLPRPVPSAQLPRTSLMHQFVLICLIVVGAGALNLVLIKTVVDDSRYMSDVVSISGKLRMLGRKIELDLIEYERLPGHGSQAVSNGMAEFEQLLKIISEGGRVFNIPLPGLADAHRHLMDGLRRNWILYRVEIEAILAAQAARRSGETEVSAQSMLRLQRQLATRATALLHASEQMTSSILHDIEASQIGALRSMVLGILLLFAVLVAAAFMMRRKLLHPLDGMLHAAQRLAQGDYGVRFAPASTGELGALASELNGAAQRMDSTLDCLRRSHRALQETERLFRGLSSIPDLGICGIRDRHLIFANPQLAQLLGYDHPGQLQNMSVQMLFVDAECSRVWEAPQSECESTVLSIEQVCLVRRYDGARARMAVRGLRQFHGERSFAVCLIQKPDDARPGGQGGCGTTSAHR